MATPEEKRKYKASGALYANQREEDESLKAFAARVAEDMRARPDRYFARIEIARLDQDLDDCAAELWQQQKSFTERAETQTGIDLQGLASHRNPCSYLPICLNKNLETQTPPGFVRSEDIHRS